MRPITLSALVFVVSGAALATSNYPAEVKAHLSLGAVPQCTLCHLTNAGGAGTANTPFGKSGRTVCGMTGGGNLKVLDAALDKLQAAGTDSDLDGVADITELKNGTDPNVKNDAPGVDGGTGGGAGGGGTPPPPPSYGCGASAVPTLFGLGGLALLAGLLRRRR